MTIARIIPNFCSTRLEATREFYSTLLGFEVRFESAWYLQLGSPVYPALEIGFIRRDHQLVPKPFQGSPRGTYLTVVVEAVERVYAQAQQMGCEIMQAPQDEFYGQRRMLLVDPNGLLIDVSSPVGNAE